MVAVLRDDGDFVELDVGGPPPLSGGGELAGPRARRSAANPWVMVPDMERYRELAREVGVHVLQPSPTSITGLRGFTIAGPASSGVRSGTRLQEQG